MEHCTKRPSDGAKPVLDVPSKARMSVDEFFRSILQFAKREPAQQAEFTELNQTFLKPVIDVASSELKRLEERATAISSSFDQLLTQSIAVPAGSEYTRQMQAEAQSLNQKHAELGKLMALNQKLRLTEQLISAVYDANCAYIDSQAAARALDAAGEACWDVVNKRKEELAELNRNAESVSRTAETNTAKLDTLYSELAQLEDALLAAPGSESLIHAALDPSTVKPSCLAQLQRICEEYGATVTYTPTRGLITLDFLAINVDIDSGALSYTHTLPSDGFEVLHYIYNHLDPVPTARQAMKTWQWGLSLSYAVVALSAAGEREISRENGQLMIKQSLKQFNTVLSIRLHGLKLAVSGCTPDVTDPRVDALLQIRPL